MKEKNPDHESMGELMYVKCAYCGKWIDVKPGQMNWVSHGMCEDCLRKEIEKVGGGASSKTEPGGGGERAEK
jgi:hypothetical protein